MLLLVPLHVVRLLSVCVCVYLPTGWPHAGAVCGPVVGRGRAGVQGAPGGGLPLPAAQCEPAHSGQCVCVCVCCVCMCVWRVSVCACVCMCVHVCVWWVSKCVCGMRLCVRVYACKFSLSVCCFVLRVYVCGCLVVPCFAPPSAVSVLLSIQPALTLGSI